jgi:hypothetical protein
MMQPSGVQAIDGVDGRSWVFSCEDECAELVYLFRSEAAEIFLSANGVELKSIYTYFTHAKLAS